VITPLDFIKMSGTEMDDWHHVVIECTSWYSGLCPTPMKPALKSRCRLVIPDVDKRKEEVHLGHLLLLPSIEQLLKIGSKKTQSAVNVAPAIASLFPSSASW
jgi:hypothetical protein